MTDFERKSKELYKEFLKGNDKSFEEIIKLYHKQLIQFIQGYVNNIEIAEDLAQDTFLYVLIKKNEYDFKYTLKTYLYTIAKCRAINYLKKEKRKVEFKEKYIYELEEIDFDRNIIKDENFRIIQKIIKQLKPQYQTALYLKYFQNFENNEICKILNKNIYQTRILIYRARKSLKKFLENGGYKYDK